MVASATCRRGRCGRRRQYQPRNSRYICPSNHAPTSACLTLMTRRRKGWRKVRLNQLLPWSSRSIASASDSLCTLNRIKSRWNTGTRVVRVRYRVLQLLYCTYARDGVVHTHSMSVVVGDYNHGWGSTYSNISTSKPINPLQFTCCCRVPLKYSLYMTDERAGGLTASPWDTPTLVIALLSCSSLSCACTWCLWRDVTDDEGQSPGEQQAN